MDGEVRWRFAGPRGLRPDSRVGGGQRIVWKLRPIAADCGIESFASRRIDCVIEGIDPFDVRAETRLTPEVESQVDTKSAWFRQRIDEVAERRASADGEIASLSEVVRWDCPWVEAAQGLGNVPGSEARRID